MTRLHSSAVGRIEINLAYSGGVSLRVLQPVPEECLASISICHYCRGFRFRLFQHGVSDAGHTTPPMNTPTSKPSARQFMVDAKRMIQAHQHERYRGRLHHFDIGFTVKPTSSSVPHRITRPCRLELIIRRWSVETMPWLHLSLEQGMTIGGQDKSSSALPADKLTGTDAFLLLIAKTLLQVRTSYRRTSLYLVGPLTQVVIDDSWYRRRIGYEMLPLCYHAD
ncbi:unnamed protein product [Fusarium fujikuroi]|nr:unnamed protein product [Fusarium fujikuroi]